MMLQDSQVRRTSSQKLRDYLEVSGIDGALDCFKCSSITDLMSLKSVGSDGGERLEEMNFFSRRAPRAVSSRSFQSKKLDDVRTGMLLHLLNTEDDVSVLGSDITIVEDELMF